MQTSYTFLIESEQSVHKLLVNGQTIGVFATLDAAKTQAANVAGRVIPGAALTFALDFKWTLTDLELRAATLELPHGETALTNH